MNGPFLQSLLGSDKDKDDCIKEMSMFLRTRAQEDSFIRKILKKQASSIELARFGNSLTKENKSDFTNES